MPADSAVDLTDQSTVDTEPAELEEAAEAAALVVQDLVVEEISIDGMCGVY